MASLVGILLLDGSSSYSDIFAFPLSIFGLGREVLRSLGGSCGLLNLVEIVLSSSIDLGLSSSSVLSRSFVDVPGGVGSCAYHDVVAHCVKYVKIIYPI